MDVEHLDRAYRNAELELARAREGGALHADYLPQLKAANEAWGARYRPGLVERDRLKAEARQRAQAIFSGIAAGLSKEDRDALAPFTTLSL